MKKVLLLFAICTMCSCTIDAEKKKAIHEKLDSIENNEIYSDIREVEIKGHIYLIYNGYHEGNIIHAEHCPCKK